MRYVAISVPLTLLATAGFMVDQNLINFCVAIAATVGTVIAVTRYIDKKIDSKIQSYAQVVRAEFRGMQQEISNLRAFLTGAPPTAVKDSEGEG